MSVAPPDLRALARTFALTFVLEAMLIASLVLRHDAFPDVDGMYHAKMGWLLYYEGFRRDFPWMVCSITAEHWADHHFLYHALIAPLAPLGLVLMHRAAAIAVGALGLAATLTKMAKDGARPMWFWALALPLCGDVFLYRMVLTRAMPLCLALLVLFVDALEANRPRRVALAAFVAMWAYQGALFFAPIAVFAAAIAWRQGRPGAVRLVAYALGGLVLGLSLNPFAPATWDFLMLHLGPYLSHGRNTLRPDIGPEWAPATWSLAPRVWPAIALGAVVPLAALARRRFDPRDALLAVTLAMFTVSTLRSQRFIEYAAPVAVMLGARALSRGVFEGLAAPRVLRWLRAGAMAAFALAGAWHWREVDAGGFRAGYREAEGAARFLASHTAPGEVVFHGGWAEFAPLFFFNHHNRYLYGLDPYFFVEYDPRRYVDYRRVVAGDDADPVAAITGRFGSRWVLLVARPESMRLARQLGADRRARVAWRDDKVLIFVLQP